MNSARKLKSVSDSDPRSVLRAITASGHDLSTSMFEFTPMDEQADLPENADPVSLRINPDTQPGSEDAFETPVESAKQIQQLATRLKQNELELEVREAELAEKIAELDQARIELESESELKKKQLAQRASQVRCQQLHLMQLQTDIVKSHNVTKKAIEALVSQPGSDANTVALLKVLKYELSGRFDYITRRWEHLAELMQNTRMQNAAREAIDDSVDWTGELS